MICPGVLIGGIGMGYSAVAIPDIIREADAHLTASNSSEDTSNTTPLIPSILATSEELSWFGMVHIKIEKKTDKYDLVSIAELEPEPEPPGAAIFCLDLGRTELEPEPHQKWWLRSMLSTRTYSIYLRNI